VLATGRTWGCTRATLGAVGERGGQSVRTWRTARGAPRAHPQQPRVGSHRVSAARVAQVQQLTAQGSRGWRDRRRCGVRRGFACGRGRTGGGVVFGQRWRRWNAPQPPHARVTRHHARSERISAGGLKMSWGHPPGPTDRNIRHRRVGAASCGTGRPRKEGASRGTTRDGHWGRRRRGRNGSPDPPRAGRWRRAPASCCRPRRYGSAAGPARHPRRPDCQLAPGPRQPQQRVGSRA